LNRRPALIAGLVGVVVALLMVVGLIMPKATQVRTRQREVEKAAQQEGALRVQLQGLQAAAKEAPKDRRTLKRLDKQVPTTANLPGLIRLLNKASDEAGVDFMVVAPGQPVASASGQYSIIPLSITVVGGFFAVDHYLFLLEELPRVSKVESMVVTPGPQQLPQLQISLTANFFTTDVSAGPGSVPGPTSGLVPGQPAAAEPSNPEAQGS
jgi:Tfp pilus assembly protein PilO